MPVLNEAPRVDGESFSIVQITQLVSYEKKHNWGHLFSANSLWSARAAGEEIKL